MSSGLTTEPDKEQREAALLVGPLCEPVADWSNLAVALRKAGCADTKTRRREVVGVYVVDREPRRV